VTQCRVLNGDDCITIKSGSQNVLVEDLYCEHGDGLTIGSVWYDDVLLDQYRRVVMNRTYNGPMIKGRSQGNATVKDIVFEDITLIDVFLALTIDCDYETQGSVNPNIGVKVENIVFRNISGTVIPKGHRSIQGDPTFLTDAAGTFFGRPKRGCTFTLEDINIRHGTASNATQPPVWSCNSTDVTATSVSPPLSSSCLSHEWK